jgi:hypothetical protein
MFEVFVIHAMAGATEPVPRHAIDDAISRVAPAKVLHMEPARPVCTGGIRPADGLPTLALG